jgi:hypothetical protein
MTEKWKEERWAEDIWYRGKLTRRRLVGWGGGAIGAMILVPAPWRAAFGAAKPYKIGSEQPLSGAGQDRSGRIADGRRPHQQQWRHQWSAG